MNRRHATTVALAAWLLVLPYDGVGPSHGKWSVRATYASRSECEKAAKQIRIQAYQSAGTDVLPRSAEARFQNWRGENATCISAEDPPAKEDRS